MEKQIYYNETILVKADKQDEDPVEIYLTYDLLEDSIDLQVNINTDLALLEKFAKDLLKFVNEIKKDNK